MGRTFATTSGKGGVGKSTVSVGLAAAFGRMGKRVLLVDMDEGLRCLDLMLGIDESAVLDLSDILGGASVEDAAYRCAFENTELIAAPAREGVTDPEKFGKFARDAREIYDIVIFDFPAGIDFLLYGYLPEETVFLTVAVPDPVSVRDAAAVSGKLEEMSLKSRLIINRFMLGQTRKLRCKNIDAIIDDSGLRLIGIVPESEELGLMSLNHSLKKRSRAAKAFMRIAGRLCEDNIPLPKLKKI